MKNSYPYVRAWYGFRMGDDERRVRNMVQVAADEEAPQTAVYRLMNGSWATLDELQPSERYAVEVAVQVKADSFRADLERLDVYEKALALGLIVESHKPGERERCRMIRQTLEEGLAVWKTA